MTNYQVNFLVKAIVSVDVKAANVEEAIKLAKDKMSRRIFVTGLDVHDETSEVCGYDDNDMWTELSS